MAVVTVVDPTAQSALADWALRDRSAALRLFVPAARAPAVSARLALGFALRESLWMGSDPAVSDAKSAWWIEELALTERGGARHPLTRLLAVEDARAHFGALARALSGLRATMPESGQTDLVGLAQDMETALWFGPGPPDAEACLVRARAGLVDVLERRAHAPAHAEKCVLAMGVHAAALRAAMASDPWTGARRAQALCWLDSMGEPAAPGPVRRWREVWKVWQAVRNVPGRISASVAAGDRSGI